MAVGLEPRAPFLDHRVAHVAWRLPMPLKIRGIISKWALSQILYQHVPQEFIERPKDGLCHADRPVAKRPLARLGQRAAPSRSLQPEIYLRPEPITRLWHQHLSGRYDHTTKLWSVLMWQAWLDQWG